MLRCRLAKEFEPLPTDNNVLKMMYGRVQKVYQKYVDGSKTGHLTGATYTFLRTALSAMNSVKNTYPTPLLDLLAECL